jgi:hypothetical protein
MGVGCAMMLLPLLFVGGCVLLVGTCAKTVLPPIPPRGMASAPAGGPGSWREQHGPPGAAIDQPEPKAEVGAEAQTLATPLKNGVVIDNDLSVAITRIDRFTAVQFGYFDCADITLAFRRMSTKWYKSPSDVRSRAFRVIVFDDRANKYEGSFYLDSEPLAGTPSGVQDMPVGFTWTGKVNVRMPAAAPIEKVELERTRHKGMFEESDTQLFVMNISNPTVPDFDFDIPRAMLLSEGALIESGRDLRAKLGHLSVRDSYAVRENSGYGKLKNEGGLSLRLPVEFTNTDYNVREATVPGLSVQFEDGRVLQEHTQLIEGANLIKNAAWGEADFFAFSNWEDKPNSNAMLETAIPGNSKRTLVLGFDVPARINAVVGLNVRRILLYGKDRFRGFVCIPDDARECIRAVADKGSTKAVNEDKVPAEQPLTQDALSGTWKGPVALFQVEDDGASATVNLISSSVPIHKFYGRLTRSAEGADSKSLKGIVDVVGPDAPRHYPVHVNATLDDQDHLRVECSDWPVWNNAGGYGGMMPVTETWTRQK